MVLMDLVFSLEEEARAPFLQSLVQSVGCTYVCIWSYYEPPANCLLFTDGLYNEQRDQPSSSHGSLAQRLFNDYRQLIYRVDNGYVPGLAFQEGLPYLELRELDLLSRVSNETQRQFYQEARIEAAAFMGCRSGEIEIGYSFPTQINMEMEMRRWFPDDFYLRSQSHPKELPRAPEQMPPSSSSSSLRSLSMGSPPPEYPFHVFNIPSSSNIPESLKETATEPTSTGISMQPYQLGLEGLHHLPFPNPQRDDAAMTRAMLSVISSSSSPSSPFQPQQYPPHNNRGAFKTYIPPLGPKVQTKSQQLRTSMLKRTISFLASMRLKKLEEQMQRTHPQPTSTQLTHMISERRRREKLNESFQALRSFLPPGSKKDKASVLSSIREYLQALKAEVLELKQKNQQLESRLSSVRETGEEVGGSTSRGTERVDIQVIKAAESTSEGEGLELRVTVREECNMMDLVIRILEFLKTVDMGLVSVEADTQLQEQQTRPLNRVVIRLNTKGNQWDESAFREAIARIIADVTPPP